MILKKTSIILQMSETLESFIRQKMIEKQE